MLSADSSCSRWMSWMGSGTSLSQFLRDFLPTRVFLKQDIECETWLVMQRLAFHLKLSTVL